MSTSIIPELGLRRWCRRISGACSIRRAGPFETQGKQAPPLQRHGTATRAEQAPPVQRRGTAARAGKFRQYKDTEWPLVHAS